MGGKEGEEYLNDSRRKFIAYYKAKEIVASQNKFSLNDLIKLIDELETDTDFIDPIWGAINSHDNYLVSILKKPSIQFLKEEISNLSNNDEMRRTRKMELEILKNLDHDMDE